MKRGDEQSLPHHKNGHTRTYKTGWYPGMLVIRRNPLHSNLGTNTWMAERTHELVAVGLDLQALLLLVIGELDSSVCSHIDEIVVLNLDGVKSGNLSCLKTSILVVCSTRRYFGLYRSNRSHQKHMSSNKLLGRAFFVTVDIKNGSFEISSVIAMV